MKWKGFIRYRPMSTRIQFNTDGYSVVVCRHPNGKYLAVKETKGRGWWLPAGHVDYGQNFVEAALRETVEEAGLHVNLKGILAVEHTLCSNTFARMRVIFYAEPIDPFAIPKTIPDSESEGAAWLSLSQLQVRYCT
jgi:8-oxo-dGTP pyrophosphatase MutT (NUDIX family)